jgi:hypothetical protein
MDPLANQIVKNIVKKASVFFFKAENGETRLV